jgi:hypothetical protein
VRMDERYRAKLKSRVLLEWRLVHLHNSQNKLIEKRNKNTLKKIFVVLRQGLEQVRLPVRSLDLFSLSFFRSLSFHLTFPCFLSDGLHSIDKRWFWKSMERSIFAVRPYAESFSTGTTGPLSIRFADQTANWLSNSAERTYLFVFFSVFLFTSAFIVISLFASVPQLVNLARATHSECKRT